MPYRMFACMVAWSAVIVAVFATAAGAADVDARPVDQSKPHFPKSELTRSREGWVLVRYGVRADGTVVDPVIDLSSGSDAFNKAAMDAVANWRYETGNAGTSSALLTFVYDRKRLLLTKRFVMRNARIHRAIDNGDFDDAERRIAAIRDYDELLASELAYSFITEARLAEARGDPVRQLGCFRKALLNDGRWVTRETYFDLLYAAVVLELQQRDYASALRDYGLLMNAALGRDRAADLAPLVEEVRPLLAASETAAPPHSFADLHISTERELRRGRIAPTSAPAPQRDPAPKPPPPRTQ